MTSAEDPETIGRCGIGSLIEDLRKQGFPVSTSEAIDATQLVVMLAGKEPAMDAERLCARLRPVFCKTRKQQESFDAIFRDWCQSVKPETTVQRQVVEKMKPALTDKPRWPLWSVIAFVLLISVISAVWLVWKTYVQENPATTGTFSFSGDTSEGGAGIGGSFDKAAADQQPATVLGYFPELRYNNELRPVWGWIFAALPLGALIGFSVPALLVIRSARARRRSEPMYLDRRALEEEARRVVPPLRPEIAGKLARHLRGAPDGEFRLTRRPILDVRATIEKTLHNRGIPSPQYRHTHAPPSYLLLIDVANQRDPRGRLFYQWAERLQRERLEVEIAFVRLHDGQPQFRPTSRGEFPRDDTGWTPLRRLPEPPFGQRLLLVSAGELLAENGKWREQASAARLHRWRQRAMFTPIEPRDWGLREETIERAEHTGDPGFLVLPLDENALSAWTDLLTTGQLSGVVLTEPQRFPGVLRHGKANDFNQDGLPPDPKTLEKLIAQLRIYLGDIGFAWLAAIAIPPLVRWELTVLLGREVIQRIAEREHKDVNLVLSRNYRRLVRLPWLLRETMPNWLRLRLLAELPSDIHEKLRDVVEKLLGKLSPAPRDDGVALEFERPPGSDTMGSMPAPSDNVDPLYLGYMSGLSPRQLAMRAPKEWGTWLGKMRIPRPRGVRGFFAATADYARSWWARVVFRSGSPFSGVRRGPMIASSLLVLLAAGCLWFIGQHGRYWWPESMDSWLFDEQAHAIGFQHGGAVRIASFSPNGLRVVTASDDGTARVWDVKSGRALTPPLRHPGAVVDAKWSPNGGVVATASGKFIYFWDAARGNLMRSWSVAGSGGKDIRKFEFNRTGTLVVLTAGSVAYVLNLTTNRAIPLQHNAEINRAIFYTNDRVITASDDRSARLWSPDGKLILLMPHQNAVLDVSTGNSDWVLTTDLDGRVQSWDTRTGVKLWQARSSTHRVVHTELGGARLVAVSSDGAVLIWESLSQTPLVLRPSGGATSASVSSDHQRIVTTSRNGTACVWDATTRRAIGSPLRHAGPLTTASFSPDGARIVTASEDGTARLWEAVNEQPDVKPLRHREFIESASFDASGRRVLTCSTGDNSAKVWSAISGVQLSPNLVHQDAVWSAVFNPDGNRVLTASDDRTAIVWDWNSGKYAVPPLRHRAEVGTAQFSPDGRRVVTATHDGTAQIWDFLTITGSPVSVLSLRHQGQVMSARFSPDGRYVVTASIDDTAKIWDATTGIAVGKSLTHVGDVNYAAFSSDGRFVVTASDDATARVWLVPEGTPLTPPLLHGGKVNYATFDPAGRVVVTVSGDKTARLWDATSGKPLHELRHDAQVWFAAFTPDGTRVATASDDCTARLWEVSTGRLLAPPMRHRTEVFRVAFSPDGKRVITATASQGDHRYVGLPTEYIAPANSAQIWHVSPYPPPDSASQAQGLRHRASLAIKNISTEWIARAVAIAAIAVVVLVVFVGIRGRRQVEILAQRAAS